MSNNQLPLRAQMLGLTWAPPTSTTQPSNPIPIPYSNNYVRHPPFIIGAPQYRLIGYDLYGRPIYQLL